MNTNKIKSVPLWLLGPLAVLCLWGWHFLDIRASVTETGHHWLYGWYVGLLLFAMALLLILGRAIFSKKELRPERLYFFAVLGIGLLYLFILAPLSAPDEVRHYISAYELSNRILGMEPANADGLIYIRKEDLWLEDIYGYRRNESGNENTMEPAGAEAAVSVREAVASVSEPAAEETAAAESEAAAGETIPVILGQLLNEETYERIRSGGADISLEESRSDTDVPLEGKISDADNDWSDETSEADARQSTSGYDAGDADGYTVSHHLPVRTTPLAYLPQALGFTLARVLGLGSIGLLFLGRLMNLLFFCTAGYFTVRRLPFGKEIYLGASLLPMTLHLAASLSYDVMILALSGYFTAVCLDLAYEREKVRRRDILCLAAAIAAMGPCKMVYGAMLGFCLLIPVKKFGDRRKWCLSAGIVLGSYLAAMAAVNLGTVSSYAQSAGGNYIDWAGEEGYVLAELLHRPLHVLKLFYDTLMWQGENLYSGMIGGTLGNLDPVLNTPYCVILAFTIGLAVLALKKPGETVRLGLGAKTWIWIICLGILAALLFSMLLAYTPRSAGQVQGVQGRYLLPLLPVFLFTLKNKRIVRASGDDRAVLYAMMAMSVYVIGRIFAVVCLRL